MKVRKRSCCIMAVAFLLGMTSFGTVAADTKGAIGLWNFRSPYAYYNHIMGAVARNGEVYYGYVDAKWSARPACNVKLDTVLFTTAAEGGKGSGVDLVQAPLKLKKEEVSEWKLTLQDETRQFSVAEKSAEVDAGETIRLTYQGAVTGEREYISVIVAKDEDALYYGRIDKPVSSEGEVSMTIPKDLKSGYYVLHVFNEQYHGGADDDSRVTDYASAFQTVILKVNNTKLPEISESVTKAFSDVHKDWYTDYVQYVYDNGLMTGIKGTAKFAPNANITKAQVAQVLYNMEGQLAVENKAVFTDLKDVYKSEWYADAVAWAYSTGVVSGDLTTKKFNPNADVTREQLALMMFRYAQYKKCDTTATSDFAGLANAHKVASWSLNGVKWAVGQGLISGIEKNGVKDLAPQGNASRAQVAAILQRFCENVQ